MLPAHHRSFAPKWQRSIEEAEQQAAAMKETTKRYGTTMQQHTEIHIESSVRNLKIKLWDTYDNIDRTTSSISCYNQ